MAKRGETCDALMSQSQAPHPCGLQITHRGPQYSGFSQHLRLSTEPSPGGGVFSGTASWSPQAADVESIT